MAETWFVTGGARSGKSAFAERLAAERGGDVVYIATMQPLDDDLRRRVARHQAARPAAWTTVEEPLAPANALRAADPAATAIIDCLSLWVTNRLLPLGESPRPTAIAELERLLLSACDGLLAAAASREAPTILVTNEVGSGVVPDTPLGRAFRDLLGRVNQRCAADAARAWLLVSGRALELPPREQPRP